MLIGERDKHSDTVTIGDYGARSLQRSLRRVAVVPPERIRTLPFGAGLVLLRSAPPNRDKSSPLDEPMIRARSPATCHTRRDRALDNERPFCRVNGRGPHGVEDNPSFDPAGERCLQEGAEAGDVIGERDR